MKYSKIAFLLVLTFLALQSCQNDAVDNAKAQLKNRSAVDKSSEVVTVSKKGENEAQVIAAVNEEKTVDAQLIEIFVEEPEEEETYKKKSTPKSNKTRAASIPKSYDAPPAKTNTRPSTPKAAPVATSAPAPRASGKAVMSFEKTTHAFGRIKPGDVINHKFKFKNTGSAPLVIENAEASCGCTHPSFPFIPIEPGADGFIGVAFDSKGKIGKQKPKVTLHTNVGKKVIYLEGMVYGELAKPKIKTDNPEEKETENSSGN